jgi:hypothetical protein
LAQLSDTGLQILNFEQVNVGPLGQQFDAEEDQAESGG